jgi:hypothetical protein
VFVAGETVCSGAEELGAEALVKTASGLLDALNGLDLSCSSDGEVRDALVAAEGLRVRCEAAVTRLVGEFDARRTWADDGAQSAATWLRTGPRVQRGRAGRLVRHARHLRGLPVTWVAYAAGDISPEVVGQIVRVDNPRTAEALRRDEAVIVGWGRDLRFDRFCQALDAWRLEHDPDGGFRDRPEARRADVAKTLGGCLAVDAWFDPVNGEVFYTAFCRIERELFDADWAAAKERLGRDPKPHELDRTPAQRRADVLVEMAERAMATPAGARRPAPLITILAGSDRFARMCETVDGTVLSDEEAAALLDQAVIERITFDGDDQPIAASVQRTFRGKLRRAIIARDRECTHPYCDAPAWRCDGDHIQPAAAHGPTSVDNGRLRCPFHNRGRNPRRSTDRHRAPPDDDPA